MVSFCYITKPQVLLVVKEKAEAFIKKRNI